MTPAEAARVLRERRDRLQSEVDAGIHGEHGDANAVLRECAALTAVLQDRARLRERIEAMRQRSLGIQEFHHENGKPVFESYAAHEVLAYDAVLDAIDAGEPPAWYDPHTAANATMKVGEPPKGET